MNFKNILEYVCFNNNEIFILIKFTYIGTASNSLKIKGPKIDKNKIYH